MRRVARVLLLAVVLAFAGCSLFGSHHVQVARITSISAPDTAFVDSTFLTTVTAMLGPDSGYVLERIEFSHSADTDLTVRIWSRDTASVRPVSSIAAYFVLNADIKPTQPGKFLVIGSQPDGSTLEKTITVLP